MLIFDNNVFHLLYRILQFKQMKNVYLYIVVGFFLRFMKLFELPTKTIKQEAANSKIEKHIDVIVYCNF